MPVAQTKGEQFKIRDTGASDLVEMAVFTILVCALCAYIAVIAKGDSAVPTVGWYIVWFGFPILCFAGLILLITHRRRFGGASLFLNESPLRIGDEIVGVIHSDKPLPLVSPMKIRLRCVRRLSQRSGAIERSIAASESQIGAELLCANESEHSTVIPVRVRISDRGKPSAVTWGGGRILWILEVEAMSKKPNFHVLFVVPIKGSG
jgi:hypothetical protein